MLKLPLCFILFFIIISSSCDKKSETSSNSSAKELVAIFPVKKLVELVGEITSTERDQLIEKGESDNWKLLPEDVKNDQITIRNKQADDNSVKFFIYRTKGDSIVVATQQINEHTITTNFWTYKPGSDEEWVDYPMPVALIEDFTSENVLIPDNFKNSNAANYIDVSLAEKQVTYMINDWNFIKEISANYQTDEGALSESYVKYNLQYYWDGTGFTAEKKTNSGYKADPTLRASIVEEDENGPGVNEFDCAHGVSVGASSQLSPEGGNSYEPALVLDGKDETAWAVADGGVGQSITFTIREQFLIGNSFQLRTGYTKSKDAWKANNRVKKLKAFVNGKLVSHIDLEDTDAYQSFIISPSWMKDSSGGKVGDKIRFEIEEIYKGDKYNDTLISYFVPTGNCG